MTIDPSPTGGDRSPTGSNRSLTGTRPDGEEVARGLAQLVLTLVELLRQLMERQAIRRVEAGGLDDDQLERLGQALMALEQRMDELKQQFDLTDDDLNLNLGPLGNLL